MLFQMGRSYTYSIICITRVVLIVIIFMQMG
jgi:hypothetical protein